MSPVLAEGLYRLLLRAYPPEFRAEYGREMVLLFRDQCQESDVRTVQFWAAVIWDVARSAPALRAQAWRTMEGTMKLIATLTVLLGACGVVGAAIEWVAGSQQSMSGAHVLAIVLGVVASVVLLGAGVAILLGMRQAARLALVASFVVFVAARVVFPWMSYFLQIVGFGLPVALVTALYWPRKPSTLGAGAASIVLVLVSGLAVPAAAAQAKPGDTTQAADTVKDLPLTAAQRKAFAGNYYVTLPMGGADVLRIFEEDGVLKAYSPHEDETRRLLYQGGGAFRPEGVPNFIITFVLAGGRATRFTVRREDGVVVGVRTQ